MRFAAVGKLSGLLPAKTSVSFQSMEKLPVCVIALIDGFALGAGNELAMVCRL